jgi:uncharacterized membrane protein
MRSALSKLTGVKGLLAVMAGLALLRVLFGFGAFSWLHPIVGGLGSAAIFIAAPLFGLYLGAEALPKARWAALWLVLGAAAHIGFFLLGRQLGPVGAGPVVVEALMQSGLLAWSFGLGILVGWLIKDLNLLAPVAIFLIGFDVFLVFTPNTFVGNVIRENPEVLQAVAMSVPASSAPEPEAEVPSGPRVTPIAMVGPADLIFSTTFFFILHRFGMRVKKTLKVLIPVLGVYLVMALTPGVPGLPALVPIGFVILWVNRSFFKMTRDEKLGTLLVTILSAGLAAYGIYRGATAPPPKPEAPANQADAPEALESDATPAPAAPDQSPS